MCLNVFDAVKESVDIRAAVESCGVTVHRGGMCCCPFHRDKNPSMKIYDSTYHCFGCGETGDVIQFAAKMFGLSRYEAARKLAEDFGISYDRWKPEKDEKGQIVKPKPKCRSPEQIYREKEQLFYRNISDHYHRLKNWKEIYRPESADEEWDEHFVEALKFIPVLEQAMDAFLDTDRAGREELFRTYEKLADFCQRRNTEARAESSVLEKLKHQERAPEGSRKEQRSERHKETTREAIAI